MGLAATSALDHEAEDDFHTRVLSTVSERGRYELTWMFAGLNIIPGPAQYYVSYVLNITYLIYYHINYTRWWWGGRGGGRGMADSAH